MFWHSKGPPSPGRRPTRVTATAWDALALKLLTDFSLVFRQKRSCDFTYLKLRRSGGLRLFYLDRPRVLS